MYSTVAHQGWPSIDLLHKLTFGVPVLAQAPLRQRMFALAGGTATTEQTCAPHGSRVAGPVLLCEVLEVRCYAGVDEARGCLLAKSAPETPLLAKPDRAGS